MVLLLYMSSVQVYSNSSEVATLYPNQTSFTFTQLTPGTLYLMSVGAFTDAGEGEREELLAQTDIVTVTVEQPTGIANSTLEHSLVSLHICIRSAWQNGMPIMFCHVPLETSHALLAITYVALWIHLNSKTSFLLNNCFLLMVCPLSLLLSCPS